jgi:hypothetical protein
MPKIFLERNLNTDKKDWQEELELLSGESVVLRISEKTKFSAKTFAELREEARANKIDLVLEVLNESDAKLARVAGFNVRMPTRKGPSVSDIVSRRGEIKARLPDFLARGPRPEEHKFLSRNPEEHKNWSFKKALGYGVGLILVGVILVIANWVLPRGTVRVVLHPWPVQINETIKVSTEVSVPVVSSNSVLPGEMISAKRNLEKTLTSTSTVKVLEKAKGQLTIFNAFGTTPQTLVATTRFETPEGVVFRLDEKTTVPGGKKNSEGVLVPGQITVAVTADKSGSEGNIPPTKLWKIPGFKGTPRYEKFYAESAMAMSGGFEGERAAPVAGEIELVKKNLASDLESALRGESSVLMSENFTLLPGVEDFRLVREEVDFDVADKSKFSVFVEGELRSLVFETEMLKSVLTDLSAKKLEKKNTLTIRDFSVGYTEPQMSWASGSMVFRATGTIVFEEKVDKEGLSEKLKGLNEEEIKKVLFDLPGLDRVSVNFWPFWVKSMPNNPTRIEVIFE